MSRLSDILLSPQRVRRHPFEVVALGFFYASVSLLVSFWVFPEYSSLFMVFLAVISMLYVVQGVLIFEEERERDENSEYSILREHWRTLLFFFLLFFGFLLAYVFWVLVLPENLVFNAFSVQESAFNEIRSITGRSVAADNFWVILSNNLRVMFLSLLLALFYGAGAIFILVWNASVMGFVIGGLARNIFGVITLPQIFLKYFLHGIPEMLAYFAAALAGGILFVSVVRGDIKKGRMKRLFFDFVIMLIFSVVLLVVAALLESYVSPLI